MADRLEMTFCRSCSSDRVADGKCSECGAEGPFDYIVVEGEVADRIRHLSSTPEKIVEQRYTRNQCPWCGGDLDGPCECTEEG